MDPILNPNNYIEDGSQPYTNNLVVTKRDNVFHLFFRGEHKNLEIQPEDITISPGATGLELSTTHGSIGYYGVNKLDTDFGNGADTVNIQGTSANTTLKLNDGNDNIFITVMKYLCNCIPHARMYDMHAWYYMLFTLS